MRKRKEGMKEGRVGAEEKSNNPTLTRWGKTEKRGRRLAAEFCLEVPIQFNKIEYKLTEENFHKGKPRRILTRPGRLRARSGS